MSKIYLKKWDFLINASSGIIITGHMYNHEKVENGTYIESSEIKDISLKDGIVTAVTEEADYILDLEDKIYDSLNCFLEYGELRDKALVNFDKIFDGSPLMLKALFQASVMITMQIVDGTPMNEIDAEDLYKDFFSQTKDFYKENGLDFKGLIKELVDCKAAIIKESIAKMPADLKEGELYIEFNEACRFFFQHSILKHKGKYHYFEYAEESPEEDDYTVILNVRPLHAFFTYTVDERSRVELQRANGRFSMIRMYNAGIRTIEMKLTDKYKLFRPNLVIEAFYQEENENEEELV